MNSDYSKATYRVKGMTCAGCESRIEKILSKMDGIKEMHANFSDESLVIVYDENKVTLELIEAALLKADYELILKEDEVILPSPGSITEAPDAKDAKGKALSILQIIGIGIILIALYLVVQNTIGFNFMPAITPSMGYGLLFVVGLFTSLHCLSMCGGINISQCVSYAKPTDGTLAKLRISGMYNLGRVVSYTIVGGIVGALGSAVEFSGWAKGSVAVVSGLFMVVLGISMLGIFPKINKIVPRMPRFMQKKTDKAAKGKGPLVVGLLTGLMPCGPLQAMQIYALGTGSYITGALSMFFFSLGTVPLMFGLGALSTMLGSRFTHRMLKASAVLVLILGVVMINRGLVLSGVNAIELPSFGATDIVEEASIQDGFQLITSKVEADAFPEITVTKGIPVKWTLQVAAEDLNTCNNEILIPAYNVKQKLNVGDNIIEFTPSESGTIPYSCWMGMIKSKIHVEASNGTAPDTEVGAPEEAVTEADASDTATSEELGQPAADIPKEVAPEVAAPVVPIAPAPANPEAVGTKVTLTGFIQDQDCFIQYAPDYGADTKMCLSMHACAASGYGITALQDDGTYKFYYFDGNFAVAEPFKEGTGSQLAAWNLINKTSKKSNITISATGTLNGNTKISPYDGLSYPVLVVSSLNETD